MNFFDEEKDIAKEMCKFWERKTRNILVYSEPKEFTKLSNSETICLLKKFSEKLHADSITTEEQEKIFMTIHFSQWPKDKIQLCLYPKENFCRLYVESAAGLADADQAIEVSDSSYRFNLQATLAKLEKFIKNYPKHRKQAEQKPDEIIKKDKLDEMARKSIETIVPQMMAGTSFEWCLQQGARYYTLCVKSNNNKMLMISFTLKNFSEKISQLVNLITQMNNLLEQSPLVVEIRNCDRYIRWQKSGG